MKRLLLPLITICCSINLLVAQEGEKYLRRAIELINMGNYQDAVGDLQKIKEWDFKQDSTIYLDTDSAFRAVDYFVRTNQPKDLIDGFRLYFLINNDLYSLGKSLYKEGNIKKALPLFEWMTSLYRDIGGNQSALYAEMSNNLGVLYSDLGDYPLAVEYHLQAVQIRKIVLGEKHPIYASSLQNLGSTYTKMGDYEDAEYYKLEALRIRKEVYGENSLEYAQSLNGLGVLYDDWGKFKDSEQYYFQALEIRQSLLGHEHSACAYTLCNIGALYLHMGDFAKAEQYLLKSLDICQSTLGEHHPLYATITNNLGGAYREIQKYVQAKSYLQKTLEICESTYGKNNYSYVTFLSNIGSVCSQLGEFQDAERFLLKALNIQNSLDDHNKAYLVQNNLGDLYHKMGMNSIALRYYTEAMENHTNLFGEDHPDAATILGNISKVYREMGDESNAISYLMKSLNIYKKYFLQSLNFMSERQRNSYWNKMRKGFEKDLPVSAYRRPTERPSLSSAAYDNEIFVKGLLLQSSDAIKHSILSSKDSILLEQWNRLISTQCNINKLKNNNPFSPLILQYEHQADSIEKIITKSSSAYRENIRQWNITWDSVRAELKPNQAAIEYMSAPLNEDSTMYCALLLRDTCSYPIMIPLFEEKQVTQKYNTSSGSFSINTTYAYQQDGKELSALIWNKVQPYLNMDDEVFFSPTGILHQIAIENLPYDETHTMADVYHMVRLSSTRELAMHKQPIQQTSAALYGDIAYQEMDANTMLALSSKYNDGTRAANPSRLVDLSQEFEPTAPLPGTKAEIDSIAPILKNQHIAVKVYAQQEACEESVKALSGQKRNILHISTHGFFRPDNGKNSDPMDRCGLYFAGVDKVLKDGNSALPGNVDDGILTAKEISLLDLRDADLVVLSACETGLGDISGEGVFGLQRAFKMAGARTILMTLWRVHDDATRMLMTAFYRHYGQTHNKRTAFRAAQQEVRATYQDPYYWAGFIMLD